MDAVAERWRDRFEGESCRGRSLLNELGMRRDYSRGVGAAEVISRFGRDVEQAGVGEAFDLRGVTLTKGGVFEPVSEFHGDFAIRDFLVGQGAFAVGFRVFGAEGRHVFAESFGEPAEEMDLGDRFVVDGVIDFALATVDESGDDGADEIVAVDHVEETQALAGDAGFIVQELFEEMSAIGSVDAGDTQNDGGELIVRGFEKKRLGFDEDLGGGCGGIGGAGFFDQRTIVLAINRGAAGV